MYIEKSYDWGQTWKIMRYFAADCTKSFPGIRKGAPQSLEDVVCQERYSRITPGTKGAVIYRVLPPQVTRVIDGSSCKRYSLKKIVKIFQVKFYSDNFSPYAKEVQELLKTTNLRIHFTELHTLGDENLQTHQGIKVH